MDPIRQAILRALDESLRPEGRRRQLDRRMQILDAATAPFITRKYRKTAVEDVAPDAGG